jgi:hypothetical protein
MTDTDLFGNPLDAGDGPRPPRVPLNDMSLIEKVLQIAETTGYVLVGASERVYHLVGRGQIEIAPLHEADAVHQLLDAQWLTKGATHTYTCRGDTGPGNSVLVPRSTKFKSSHWRALVPLTGSTTRKGTR